MNSETTATKNGLTPSSPTDLPLIAPKHFSEFSPEEFHQHVKNMYELRQVKGSKAPKKPSYAEGLTLKRTKKGALSITRSAKKRPFPYVLQNEIEALAKGYSLPISEVWNAFRTKQFIISTTRVEAEKIKADMAEIPW